MMKTRIAAVFDVDGTLVAGDSLERIFLKFLWRYGELGGRDLLLLAKGAGGALAEGRSPLRTNKAYLRGRDAGRVARLARDCFDQEIARRLLPAAISRLRWHQEAGHCVVLLSGTLNQLIEPLAERLGVCARVGTQVESAGRCLTGRISGRHLYGPAKADCLAEMNRGGLFDLPRSFAYANHYTDRHLLAMVGRPVAANPDRRLRALAGREGWMIEEFTDGAGVPTPAGQDDFNNRRNDARHGAPLICRH